MQWNELMKMWNTIRGVFICYEKWDFIGFSQFHCNQHMNCAWCKFHWVLTYETLTVHRLRKIFSKYFHGKVSGSYEICHKIWNIEIWNLKFAIEIWNIVILVSDRPLAWHVARPFKPNACLELLLSMNVCMCMCVHTCVCVCVPTPEVINN